MKVKLNVCSTQKREELRRTAHAYTISSVCEQGVVDLR